MSKLEVKQSLVDLYLEYNAALDVWNSQARRYGAHQDPSFEGFIDWLSDGYIKEQE